MDSLMIEAFVFVLDTWFRCWSIIISSSTNTSAAKLRDPSIFSRVNNCKGGQDFAPQFNAKSKYIDIDIDVDYWC